MIGDHVFESFNKDEVLEFQEIINPDYWEQGVRRDLKTFEKVYILSWTIVDQKECDKALKRWKEYQKSKQKEKDEADHFEKQNIQPDYKQYISIEWLKKYASLCCTFDMNLAAIHFVQTWIDMNEKCCCEKKEQDK